MRRAASVALISGLLVVVAASPAMAHGRGSDASNFNSTITADPQVAGLRWQIINSDEYLQVTNSTDVELQVPGYQGEPYLRIGPDGVYRNRTSPATYINDDRYGQTVVPPDVDPDGEPVWEQVSGSSTYAWHDHRIHWMATANPPAVQTDPDSVQLVTTWTVPFTVTDQVYELAGELFWIPGGSALAWLLPALLIVSVPVAVALWRSRPDVDAAQWRGLSTPTGIVLLVLALLNVLHLIDDVFATPIPLSQSAVNAIQTAVFIAMAIAAATRTIQGREGAFTALGVGVGAVFIGQGLLYFSVLSASQTASVSPGWLTRVVIALSVAQVIPLGVAAVLGTRALIPEWDDEEHEAEAGGLA